jgi:hypothetical protein
LRATEDSIFSNLPKAGNDGSLVDCKAQTEIAACCKRPHFIAAWVFFFLEKLFSDSEAEAYVTLRIQPKQPLFLFFRRHTNNIHNF